MSLRKEGLSGRRSVKKARSSWNRHSKGKDKLISDSFLLEIAYIMRFKEVQEPIS
jgi:hypothetical protein